MGDIWDVYGPIVVTALALTLGFVAVGLSYGILRRIGRRVPRLALVARRTHKPGQLLVALLAARFAVLATTDAGAWRAPLLHGLLVAAIAAGGWLVGTLLLTAVEVARARLDLDGTETPHARRAQTQLVLLQRVTVAAITVVTIGAALYTFPAVKGIGTSVLASAGLIGVVAGLAAQSMLGNLFAGLQLAFGDRLRIEDVVVVEGEWGRVEEITLGYVVVRIWDQRRLILPTSYFTSTPFVSWTRRDAEVLDTVELDVDWTVPVPQMRAELERFVRGHPLWDSRSVSLQVTRATDSLVRVRAVVSAGDGSKVWDLRCDVREHLVEWVRRCYPHALPRVRADLAGSGQVAVPSQHHAAPAVPPAAAPR
jgi:small-conductance mechanosensitive channel